jgi:hypothetical protein
MPIVPELIAYNESPVLAIGEESPFILMRPVGLPWLCDGNEFDDVVVRYNRSGQLTNYPPPAVLTAHHFIQLIDILEKVHSQDIYHRDVSITNFFCHAAQPDSVFLNDWSHSVIFKPNPALSVNLQRSPHADHIAFKSHLFRRRIDVHSNNKVEWAGAYAHAPLGLIYYRLDQSDIYATGGKLFHTPCAADDLGMVVTSLFMCLHPQYHKALRKVIMPLGTIADKLPAIKTFWEYHLSVDHWVSLVMAAENQNYDEMKKLITQVIK